MCAVRRNDRHADGKKKKRGRKEEYKEGRSSANSALHGDTEEHSLRGSPIPFPTELNSKVCVFVRTVLKPRKAAQFITPNTH